MLLLVRKSIWTSRVVWMETSPRGLVACLGSMTTPCRCLFFALLFFPELNSNARNMGKKGRWLSAIKRVFTPNSKEKVAYETEKKSGKEKKKWGLGRLRHGESNSFIPLYREPSSIEKILGDVEREQPKTRPMSADEHRKTQPLPSIPWEQNRRTPPSMPSEQHRQTPPPNSMPSRVTVNHHKEIARSPILTPNNYNTSAIKIQAAYRGYMARRSFRALKGLVRLQGVVRGQSVKRQTMNAMKYMQLLVRVQSQIQSRRIQMLENQALQRQNLYKGDKDQESSLGKWTLTQPSETDHQEEWDDSVLTKEEIDARLQRKVEAVMKRERALAYAYSHQLWKATPKSAQTALMEIRSGGFPWWWNWLERQLPVHPSESHIMRSKTDLTPSKPILEPNLRPQSSSSKQARFGFENLETLTPTSTKSAMATKTKHVPALSNRVAQTNSSTPVKHAKPRSSAAEYSFDVPLRDDESLTSCPPYPVPNYMVPTLSAKAKARAQSNPKERLSATPSHEQKRRLSFPLTQSIGSLRWNKGSLFSSKDSTSQRLLGKHSSMQSIGNLSVDSTVSLPVGVGRPPFKRFV